jgi:hypothetical protein
MTDAQCIAIMIAPRLMGSPREPSMRTVALEVDRAQAILRRVQHWVSDKDELPHVIRGRHFALECVLSEPE